MELTDLSPSPLERYARLIGSAASDPPAVEEWLRFWNDAEGDLANLANLDHWLSLAAHQEAAPTRAYR
ncbi:MAG: hypothetical protein ABL964_17165 [Steroidobacteraceae bacterium]